MQIKLPLNLFLSATLCAVVLNTAPHAAAATLPTTTTLTVTAGGSAVTTVAPGAVVTLTATVSAGIHPVPPGTINFCDATAVHCEDFHIVGSAQLTMNGIATFKFRPAVGSHSYKAVYLGITTYAGSSSSAASLTVTPSGSIPTLSQLSYTVGSNDQFTLTSTVAATEGITAPTGTASFLEVTNGDALLASATLGTGSLSWLSANQTAGSCAFCFNTATADFNGDGIPDLAVTTSYPTPGVTIFLGNGDGTFTLKPNGLGFPTTIYLPVSIGNIATGDFNNDGIPDLAVVFVDGLNGETEVSIFLGNGIGDFQLKTVYIAGGQPSIYAPEPNFIAIADFNQDGNMDLAVTDLQNQTMEILLGRGDGSFYSPDGPLPSTLGEPGATVVDDFNGDGIPDLAVLAADDPGLVAILLGNGDGTFTGTSTTSPATGANPQYIVAADFTGNGIADLAVTSGNPQSISIFIGNGNGTFGAALSAGPEVPNGPMVLADFNGDGVPDLATFQALNATNDVVNVLLGNGDGTFTLAQWPTYPEVNIRYPEALVAADFDGNGLPDLAVTDEDSTSVSVDLIYPAAAATSSPISRDGAGTEQVNASYPGGGGYAASVSNTVTLYDLTTTLTLAGANPQYSTIGQPVTLTATLAPYTFNSNSTNGETITFSLFQSNSPGSASIATFTGTLSGGVATIAPTSIPIGQYYFVASYNGDTYLGPATSGPSSVVVSMSPSTVTLTASPARSILGQPVTLTATLSVTEAIAETNGETVIFKNNGTSIGTGTLTSGVASLNISTLGAGANLLTASYAGDSDNLAGTSNTVSEYVLTSAPAATDVTMTLTSSGSAITTVAPLTVVTLTATVTAGSTPVTRGTVNFCEAEAEHCEDVHLVGSAQLTSAGTAVFKFRPAAGSHSYNAVFVGTWAYAGSSSSASALSVPEASPIPTATQVIVTPGTDGQYSFAATVGATEGITAPEGTVSFLQVSNGNALLATENLTAGPLGWFDSTLTMEGVPGYLSSASNVVSGDFNGDGIPDLAVVIGSVGPNSSVTVMLGNGDGTFTTKSTTQTGRISLYAAVGDFNGDGILDLAVLNACSSTSECETGAVTILLGNGDGTFTATATSPAIGYDATSITVADFNRDGILDLAVANYGDNTVSVLLGNGDGTFTAAASPATGAYPYSLAVGDFNGDGIPDLAVANLDGSGSSGSYGTVTVLIGNGDGTFTPTQTSPATGYAPYFVVEGDFNQDGIPDLAVANDCGNSFDCSAAGSVTILLGNGNGAFTAAASPATGIEPVSIATGDFNGDGIVDLAVTNANDRNPALESDGSVTILLGNGDGTFTPSATSPPTGLLPFNVAAADFDGNGLSDLAVTHEGSGHSASDIVSISLTYPAATAMLTESSVSGFSNYQVDASYPGNSSYGPSLSGAVTLYQASALNTPTPAPSPTLGTSETFTWTAGFNVTEYDFQLGTTGAGSSNLYGSKPTTTALTSPAIAIPSIGVTVYARLWSRINTVWQYTDYTFTEPGSPTLSVLNTPSPAPNPNLATSETFTWTAGSGVTKYNLHLGTTGAGSSNLYDSGWTNSLTSPATTIPSLGLTVYARLFSYINGAAQYTDYTFTEPGSTTLAALNTPSPAPSPTLASSETFTWTAGTGVTLYDFHLGTAGPGTSNLYDSGWTSALTSPSIAIPSGRHTVYARLSSYINGAWQHTDYTFTEP